MAEIRVERKRGGGSWLWLVLLLVVLVAVVIYLWQAGYINLGASRIGIESQIAAATEESWRALMTV